MTITVKVSTHAHRARVLGYPKVNGEPVQDAEYVELATMEANEEREFHAHDAEDILVQELPPLPDEQT